MGSDETNVKGSHGAAARGSKASNESHTLPAAAAVVQMDRGKRVRETGT